MFREGLCWGEGEDGVTTAAIETDGTPCRKWGREAGQDVPRALA